MPTKKLSITRLKKDLWRLISNYIKNRDSHTCWHCKKSFPPGKLNCSHILPKGEYPRYEYQSWNLKTLCSKCHLWWWHKNPLEAALWFQTEYPQKYAMALTKAANYSIEPELDHSKLLALKILLEQDSLTPKFDVALSPMA